MAILAPELPGSSRIGCQAICDDCLRTDTLVLKQFSEKFVCCGLVSPLLNQHVQHLAFVIHGTPQKHSLAGDPHNYFVEMPSHGRRRPRLAQVLGKQPSEFLRPAADRLIAHIDAALSHEIFDIPKAQGEPEIQPHHLANDIRREPMASERNGVPKRGSLSALTSNDLALHSARTPRPS